MNDGINVTVQKALEYVFTHQEVTVMTSQALFSCKNHAANGGFPFLPCNSSEGLAGSETCLVDMESL